MDSNDNHTPYTYQWYIDRFEAARENAIRFCEPIDEDQFVRRPNKKVWSVAECYGHLNEFEDQYLVVIRKGLDRTPDNSAGHDQSFTPGLIARGVVKFFKPPYKIKIKTLKPFKPDAASRNNKEAVINRYLSQQDELIRILKEARQNRVAMDQKNTVHPLFQWIKMSVTECFAIVEVHKRRHMWQAEQVLDSLD